MVALVAAMLLLLHATHPPMLAPHIAQADHHGLSWLLPTSSDADAPYMGSGSHHLADAPLHARFGSPAPLAHTACIVVAVLCQLEGPPQLTGLVLALVGTLALVMLRGAQRARMRTPPAHPSGARRQALLQVFVR